MKNAFCSCWSVPGAEGHWPHLTVMPEQTCIRIKSVLVQVCPGYKHLEYLQTVPLGTCHADHTRPRQGMAMTSDLLTT